MSCDFNSISRLICRPCPLELIRRYSRPVPIQRATRPTAWTVHTIHANFLLFRSLVHRILDIGYSTEYGSVESQDDSRSFSIPVNVLALPHGWYADVAFENMLDVVSATFWFLVHSWIVSDDGSDLLMTLSSIR